MATSPSGARGDKAGACEGGTGAVLAVLVSWCQSSA